MSDVAYNQIKNNRKAIIFLIASSVVNRPTKYFMIKCFWKITKQMCLKVMARDKGYIMLWFSRNNKKNVDKYVAHS